MNEVFSFPSTVYQSISVMVTVFFHFIFYHCMTQIYCLVNEEKMQ